MFTMSAIENSKCRIRFLARGPLGRPEEADTRFAVGVQQGHGLDQELMDRYPWLVETASMEWLNPLRMAPKVDEESMKKFSCTTHNSHIMSCGSMIETEVLKAGGGGQS